MSQCISSQGDHDTHDPDNLHVCQRCGMWDKDGLRAEMAALRNIRSEVTWLRSHVPPCDANCAALGEPQEDCSRDGRKPDDLWRIIGEVQQQRDDLRAKVEALADQWYAEKGAKTDEGRGFASASRLCADELRAVLEGGR